MLPTPVTSSGLRRTWEIVSDLAIATAIIWALPLLLGVMGGLVMLLWRAG